MRLIGAAAVVFALTIALAILESSTTASSQLSAAALPRANQADAGQTIFRYDTFGDEQLWTNVLRMHEAIATVDAAIFRHLTKYVGVANNYGSAVGGIESRLTAKAAPWPTIPFTAYWPCARFDPAARSPEHTVSPGAHNSRSFAA